MYPRTLYGGTAMTFEAPPGGTYGKRVQSGRTLRFGSRFMAGMYRLFGGRGVGDLLLLDTVGARSGQPRTTAVRRFEDGDGRWLIVASHAGGAKQPAWLHNLAAHPDQVWIEIGRHRMKVRPELLEGEDRAAAWQRIVAEVPQFGSYETTTDRLIPVLRLVREA
jgi:deazaflavin-dependent oxidoreductase (nitroreductase family)